MPSMYKCPIPSDVLFNAQTYNFFYLCLFPYDNWQGIQQMLRATVLLSSTDIPYPDGCYALSECKQRVRIDPTVRNQSNKT